MTSSPTFERLRALRGRRRLAPREIVELEALHRAGHRELAEARSSGLEGAALEHKQLELARVSGRLSRPHVSARALLGGIVRAFFVECPRALRAEWRLVMTVLLGFYGLAAVAFGLVRADRSYAYVLFEPAIVDHEIQQLEALDEGEAFRGNFTFDEGESPGASAMIISNNVNVTFMLIAMALVPPLFLYIFVLNAFMFGTYLAIAAGYGQLGSISSILMCHGMLELQAIAFAGVGGIVLLRALLVPGIWTRAESTRRGAERAIHIFTGCAGLLLVAGLIEGFVTPHASLAGRLAFIVLSTLALALWFVLGGRTRSVSPA